MPEAGGCGACAVSRPCPSARTECDFTLRGSVGILLAKSLGKRKDDVLLDAFERHGIFSRVQSAINMQEVSEPYIRRRAIRHMEKGRVVILAAGTGNPYFTTDTTAALRACELDVDCLMKATKVDGVYDADPMKNPDAHRFDHISYMEVLSQGLHVMDATATSLCMDNDVPMIVFDLTKPGNIKAALQGEPVGTVVE